jgi:transposase
VSDTVDLAPDAEAQIAALRADLAAANAALAARDLLIETLRVQIARMRRMKFGASSEKLDHAIAQLELALEELEAEASTVAQSKPVTAKPERPAPVRSFPPYLPREEIIHEPRTGQWLLSRLRRCLTQVEHRQRRDARCRASALARHPPCPS